MNFYVVFIAKNTPIALIGTILYQCVSVVCVYREQGMMSRGGWCRSTRRRKLTRNKSINRTPHRALRLGAVATAGRFSSGMKLLRPLHVSRS